MPPPRRNGTAVEKKSETLRFFLIRLDRQAPLMAFVCGGDRRRQAGNEGHFATKKRWSVFRSPDKLGGYSQNQGVVDEREGLRPAKHHSWTATSSRACGAVLPDSNRPAILGLRSSELRQQPATCLRVIVQSARCRTAGHRPVALKHALAQARICFSDKLPRLRPTRTPRCFSRNFAKEVPPGSPR